MTVGFELRAVGGADFEALLALRIDVMRCSLERLGRFDPVRARERFCATFRPADTRGIVIDSERAGCVACWPEEDGLRIEHFYIASAFQNHRLGGRVLRRLFDEAAPHVRYFRVGALRESDANRFYERHGFVHRSESEWDIEYERPHRA